LSRGTCKVRLFGAVCVRNICVLYYYLQVALFELLFVRI